MTAPGVAPSVGEVALSWHVDPVLVPLAAAAVAYLIAARRARRWPAWRTLAWLAGLAVVAAALLSGLDDYAARLLSLHMVQHVALTLLAAPLLLAGAPLMLALRVAGRPRRRRLAAILSSRPAGLAAHPLTCWTALAAAMLATHLTPLFGLALEHAWVHGIEHVLYLGAGMLFWVPLVPAGPMPHRLGGIGGVAYLMTAMPIMTVVAIFLGSGPVRYPQYLAPAARLGVSAAADQGAAAGIMLLAGTAAVLVATLAIAWPAILREERHARAREAQEGSGLPGALPKGTP